jgi:hypothetical protein
LRSAMAEVSLTNKYVAPRVELGEGLAHDDTRG